MAHESPIDRAIREATERGEFDNLPGAGKPLADTSPHSDQWYLEQFAKREEAGSAFLPTSLLLRREADDLPGKVARLQSETAVRTTVDALNARIAAEIRVPTGGPSLTMALLDADAIVADWAADRRRRADALAAGAAARPTPASARKRRLWSARRRR